MTEDLRRHRAVHADLPLPYDDLERRRRRGIEWCGIISRTVAGGWIVSSALLHPSAALAHRLHLSESVFGLYLALPLVASVGFGMLALRRVDSRRYHLFSLVNLVIDTLVVIALVFVVAADRSVVVWPVLVIPVVLGAVRHELVGALVAWAAVTAACVTLYVASRSLYGYQIDPPILFTGAGLDLTVAFLTGLQARGQQRHRRELVAIRAELRHQTLHDPLTGLANRSLLDDRLRTDLRTGEAVTVLALDLDGFKTVNDTFGHAAGDELLQVVAGRLRAQARDGDLVARLGGDEFVVVLAGAGEDEAREIADRMRFSLIAPIALEGNSARIDAMRRRRPGRRHRPGVAAARRRRRHVPGQAHPPRGRTGRPRDRRPPRRTRAATGQVGPTSRIAVTSTSPTGHTRSSTVRGVAPHDPVVVAGQHGGRVRGAEIHSQPRRGCWGRRGR